MEFKQAHHGDVRLDGIKVVAVYRGKTWIKFYVSDNADEQQTEAAVKLLPTFEKFFAIDNVTGTFGFTAKITATASDSH